MSIVGPYVQRIDPIIATVFGVHLWWYGLSYTLGFLNAHMFMKRRRGQLGLSTGSLYNLSLLLAVSVLLGGHLVEVAFYEWPFYREHLVLIPAYWLGGMATHGLLFGGLIGVWVFSRLHGKPFLSVTDALAIPAAVIMGLGGKDRELYRWADRRQHNHCVVGGKVPGCRRIPPSSCVIRWIEESLHRPDPDVRWQVAATSGRPDWHFPLSVCFPQDLR